MAYENYKFVSWSTGTPITGERLAQISNNIEQVKEATDGNPKGIIQIQQGTTDVPGIAGYSDFSEYEVIALKDNPPVDKRVTLGENRFYRLTLSFPGIVVKDKGAEDSTFLIRFYQGIFGSAGTLMSTWRITPPPFGYYDVSATTAVTQTSVKSIGYPTRIGAGDYSIVLDSGLGLSTASFYVAIKRDQGASANNAPAYYIPASGTPMQFYAEDVGGS
jgi:hypothetical protein